jgi:hypothetical protein
MTTSGRRQDERYSAQNCLSRSPSPTPPVWAQFRR